MRHNYVGDIGDFYKYGLLRHLIGVTANDNHLQLSLAMAWYLNEDPCKETHGNHTKYIHEVTYLSLDKLLHTQLKNIVLNDQQGIEERQIHHIRKSSVFPKGTSFFESPLHDEKSRQLWHSDSLSKTKSADLVFFDPDNGFEVKSRKYYHPLAKKYVYYRELKPFFERGQSLLIYQHRNRKKVKDQISTRLYELQKEFRNASIDWFYFPKFSGRIFFLIIQKHHRSILEQRKKSFKIKWQQHIGAALV